MKYSGNMLCVYTCRILEKAHYQNGDIESERKEQRFEKINLGGQDDSWREKVLFFFCFLSNVNNQPCLLLLDLIHSILLCRL